MTAASRGGVISWYENNNNHRE